MGKIHSAPGNQSCCRWIAERNEAERGHAVMDRVVTRSEVEWSHMTRTESGHNEQGSQRHLNEAKRW